ncbi:hypothetical protein [Jiangella rhizosphaerae]|uniref:Uncharacterized protein n=1 Tax=Jiangella rhizosphaerae TaxID=2293569 RepID=A0A418KPA8_9ACTN|nr:hypothetical protein [Jiangella rhizosphaerae]RIQ21066.1 hypothetical protein DY240_16075 [Jiangella rhizosphaerae]
MLEHEPSMSRTCGEVAMNRPADVVELFPHTAPRTNSRGGAHDVVVPGRKHPPSADPWRHDAQAGDPLHAGSRAADHRATLGVAADAQFATVHGEHHTGLLRVRLAGDGGDAEEYVLDVQQALHLSQRLRDAATAMQAFLAVRTFGPSRVSG